MTDNKFYPAYGIWFSEGKLKIATYENITVIRPWGINSGAWRKTPKSHGWKPIRPNISFDPEQAKLSCFSRQELIKTDEGYVATNQLVFPFKAIEEANAWEQFFECIPQSALKIIRHFTSRQWHVLQTLNRCGSAAFDMADCLALLFLISNNWVYGKKTCHIQRTSRRLFSIKRKEALEWLGFPRTEQTVKILQKVTNKSININFCFYLRNCLASDIKLKLLSFCPRINAGVVRLLADDLMPYVTPNLISEVGNDRTEDNKPIIGYNILDYIAVKKLLRPDLSTEKRFKSKSQVSEHHNQWVTRLNTTGYSVFEARNLNLEFPPLPDLWCPDSSILSVKGIKTPQELIILGREQRNCVATWASKVVKGDCFFYKVITSDEIVTLAIQQKYGRWIIQDIKGLSNEEPAPMTYLWVKKWLDVAQDSPDADHFHSFYDDEIPF